MLKDELDCRYSPWLGESVEEDEDRRIINVAKYQPCLVEFRVFGHPERAAGFALTPSGVICGKRDSHRRGADLDSGSHPVGERLSFRRSCLPSAAGAQRPSSKNRTPEREVYIIASIFGIGVVAIKTKRRVSFTSRLVLGAGRLRLSGQFGAIIES